MVNDNGSDSFIAAAFNRQSSADSDPLELRLAQVQSEYKVKPFIGIWLAVS